MFVSKRETTAAFLLVVSFLSRDEFFYSSRPLHPQPLPREWQLIFRLITGADCGLKWILYKSCGTVYTDSAHRKVYIVWVAANAVRRDLEYIPSIKEYQGSWRLKAPYWLITGPGLGKGAGQLKFPVFPAVQNAGPYETSAGVPALVMCAVGFLPVSWMKWEELDFIHFMVPEKNLNSAHIPMAAHMLTTEARIMDENSGIFWRPLSLSMATRKSENCSLPIFRLWE